MSIIIIIIIYIYIYASSRQPNRHNLERRPEEPCNKLATSSRGQVGTARCSNSGAGGLLPRKRPTLTFTDLRIGNWNISSLTGKEHELREEAKRYRLDIAGVSSTRWRGSGTVDLQEGWKLFYSGVDAALSAQAGVGILTSPRLADRVIDWIPLGGRVAIMKLKLQKMILTLVQVYAPNLEAEYAAFLDEVDDALQRVADTESVLIMPMWGPIPRRGVA